MENNERVRNIVRSPFWNDVMEVLARLNIQPRNDGRDEMDKPSAATQIEELAKKYYSPAKE